MSRKEKAILSYLKESPLSSSAQIADGLANDISLATIKRMPQKPKRKESEE